MKKNLLVCCIWLACLSDFLLSTMIQRFLLEFGRQTNGRGPLFFPEAAAETQKEN